MNNLVRLQVKRHTRKAARAAKRKRKHALGMNEAVRRAAAESTREAILRALRKAQEQAILAAEARARAQKVVAAEVAAACCIELLMIVLFVRASLASLMTPRTKCISGQR